MSASDAFENALAALFFHGTTWANVAVNATSSPLTNWELSLHTADPADAGTQTTSEVAYTDYARVAVARTSGGFTVPTGTTGITTLAANVDFPIGSGGSGTATYFGIGTAHTSTGILEISGTISPSIVCGSGVTPRLTTATSITIA
jgi:hypothetical protein